MLDRVFCVKSIKDWDNTTPSGPSIFCFYCSDYSTLTDRKYHVCSYLPYANL
jgi:hypothetical protein